MEKLEQQIADNFEDFTNVWRKIQNKPEFSQYQKANLVLPDCSIDLSDYNGIDNVLIAVAAGTIFGPLGLWFVGNSAEKKKDKMWQEVWREEDAINKACAYMKELSSVANEDMSGTMYYASAMANMPESYVCVTAITK